MDEKGTDYRFISEIAQENELDLREYTNKVKGELRKLEGECISDFLSVNKDVAVLYEELTTTNNILDKIENIVEGFQV